MAEGKKSFVLYTDLIGLVSHLPDDVAGRLFKLILDYVNDKNPHTDELVLNVAFEPIKQSLKRDLRKWEGYIEKQVANGKKGGRPKETQKTQAFFEEPKKADSVSVSVSVSDTVNVNDISKKEIDFLFSELPNTSHIETIAMTHNQPKAKILSMIPAFRRAADLTYPTPQKFYNHFKNWVNIQLKKQTNGSSGPKKLGA